MAVAVAAPRVEISLLNVARRDGPSMPNRLAGWVRSDGRYQFNGRAGLAPQAIDT